ncbi:hypothetical protein [Parasediminibacterium sp. JCM 36343]|uniref:hypothetical protein n=1 Tax=Parasediminibacterium sp. JCM 36343 TaxID=3374279 RepID=UPI00397B35C4
MAVTKNIIYFVFQSTFKMNESTTQQHELAHIKQMMERSSRFISLSGWSGISAGTCALVGAYFAHSAILKGNRHESISQPLDILGLASNSLVQIEVFTFIGAFTSAFFFTWLRSRKTNNSLWGSTSKRLFVNVAVPMVAGGFFLLKMIEMGSFALIAPGCLIFYGLALINASKYTLGEVKYLGYLQLLLGIANLWFIGQGLFFWSVGFGALHIVYGIVMWRKYER